MFEDSLVESQGRIRTRSKSFAVGSFFTQAAILLLLILYPLFHPEALPHQSLERLLVAPPPPRAPAPMPHAASTAQARPILSLQAQLQAPTTIPTNVVTAPGEPPPLGSIFGIPSGDSTGVPGGFPLGPSAPAVIVAKPSAPKGPVKISTGVASGLLLSPIRPIYPEIAKQARIQGTVVIDATISRQGLIENLQVIEGPPLLRQAAIDAVASARYRPFLLNGEPIEVQTSIRVIFSFGG